MLSKWIEIISLVGPKFPEVLTLILQLLRIFNGGGAGTVSPGYAIKKASDVAPLSPQYQEFVEKAKAAGADEEQAREFAMLVEAKDNEG